MEATEVSIKNILRCREFPVVVVKPYKINAIFTGFDVHKTVGLLALKRSCVVSWNQET